MNTTYLTLVAMCVMWLSGATVLICAAAGFKWAEKALMVMGAFVLLLYLFTR